MLSSSMEASRNSSWKDRRPMRATESSEVRAKADTARVSSVREASTGRPSLDRKPATPLAKILGGVPWGRPLLYKAPTATRAMTARKPSSSMEPKPMRRMWPSLDICLDVVPDETRL